MLAERSVFARFKILYADYESQNEADTESFVKKNMRSVALFGFYIVMFLLASYFSPSEVTWYKSASICMNFISNGSTFLFRLIFFFMFYFPFLYYMIAGITCFSSYFGDSNDSIRERLTSTDLNRIRLVKSITLLHCIIEICTEMHTSSFLFLSNLLYEVLRVFGFLAILAMTLLFFHHEKFYDKIKAKLFGNSLNEPQMSEPNGNRFIFRGQRDNDTDVAAVDYTNLVENETAWKRTTFAPESGRF